MYDESEFPAWVYEDREPITLTEEEDDHVFHH